MDGLIAGRPTTDGLQRRRKENGAMTRRTGSTGAALGFAIALTILLGHGPALAADAPVGKWKTIDLGPSGDRYKGGTVLDLEDGKVYKAEVWHEAGKLKVRSYLGPFDKTQTWLKGN